MTLRKQPSVNLFSNAGTHNGMSLLATIPVMDNDTSAESSSPGGGMCCFRLK